MSPMKAVLHASWLYVGHLVKLGTCSASVAEWGFFKRCLYINIPIQLAGHRLLQGIGHFMEVSPSGQSLRKAAFVRCVRVLASSYIC